MERDYAARKKIAEGVALFNGDDRLRSILTSSFDIMCKNRDGNGCLSLSVALHIIMQSLGYKSKLCYGLCSMPGDTPNTEFYHAWLEINSLVLDIAIYGNTHFSPLWAGGSIDPIVFKQNGLIIQYRDGFIDSDWKESFIGALTEIGSIKAYIASNPTGMWHLIFSILGTTDTTEKRQSLAQYISEAPITIGYEKER